MGTAYGSARPVHELLLRSSGVSDRGCRLLEMSDANAFAFASTLAAAPPRSSRRHLYKHPLFHHVVTLTTESIGAPVLRQKRPVEKQTFSQGDRESSRPSRIRVAAWRVASAVQACAELRSRGRAWTQAEHGRFS